MAEGIAGIGHRLREVRVWRGLSLRAAAGLAGYSAGYLSMIENGDRVVDRRSTLEALARALRVSPSELTGQPYPPADPLDVAAREQVAELELALSEPALGERGLPRREPWARLAAGLAELNTVHRPAADYTAQGRALPGLLAGLHAAMTHEPRHRREVLYGLLDAYHAAEELTKSLGVPGLPQLAVVHAQRVAEELDDPAALGLATWLRAIALGSAGRARVLELSVRGVDELAGALADPAVVRVTGALHLTAALASATLHRPDDSADLDHAQRLAEAQPDDAADFGLVYFTPDNVGIWRVSLAVEQGEPRRAADRPLRAPGRGAVLGPTGDVLGGPGPRAGHREGHPRTGRRRAAPSRGHRASHHAQQRRTRSAPPASWSTSSSMTNAGWTCCSCNGWAERRRQRGEAARHLLKPRSTGGPESTRQLGDMNHPPASVALDRHFVGPHCSGTAC